MKYPCCVIQDLLPLFHDGVCSEETAEIVQEHLGECEDCRVQYEKICDAEAQLPVPADTAEEMKKAALWSRFKKKMTRRNRWFAAAALVAVVLLLGVLIAWNEACQYPLPYDPSMHVYLESDGDLMLQAYPPSSVMRISQVMLTGKMDGKTENHVFVRYYVKPLEYFLCSLFGQHIDSQHVIAFADKGADAIDAVHYCTYSFHPDAFYGYEEDEAILSETNLRDRMANAVLIWEKE